MSGRDAILHAVRRAQPDPVPYPGGAEWPGEKLGAGQAPGSSPDAAEGSPRRTAMPGPDLVAAFVRAMEEAGGQVANAGDPRTRPIEGEPSEYREDIAATIAARVDALLAERFPGARVASAAPEVTGAVDLAAVDPHDLADLDVLVCRAALGVAENGAVWLPETAMGQRAAPFLAQHVVILLDREALVADLHEAYAALDVADPGFGLFVAGPSKTADIEQSLVMGAHGPRSLTVVLSGEDG